MEQRPVVAACGHEMSAVQNMLALECPGESKRPCNMCVLMQDDNQARCFVLASLDGLAQRYRSHLTEPYELPTKAGGPRACERHQKRGRQGLADLRQSGKEGSPWEATVLTVATLIVTDKGTRDALLPQSDWGVAYFDALECLVNQVAHATWDSQSGAECVVRCTAMEARRLWLSTERDEVERILAVRDAARADKHPSHVALTGTTGDLFAPGRR